jgi:hypothetical protein
MLASQKSDFRSHHDASLTEHNAGFALIYQFWLVGPFDLTYYELALRGLRAKCC